MTTPVTLVVRSDTKTVHVALRKLMNKLPVHQTVEREALIRELLYDGPPAVYAIGIYPEGLSFAINPIQEEGYEGYQPITATKLLQIAKRIRKHE